MVRTVIVQAKNANKLRTKKIGKVPKYEVIMFALVDLFLSAQKNTKPKNGLNEKVVFISLDGNNGSVMIVGS